MSIHTWNMKIPYGEFRTTWKLSSYSCQYGSTINRFDKLRAYTHYSLSLSKPLNSYFEASLHIMASSYNPKSLVVY